MTSQTRTLIEPSDICAIDLECPHCALRVIYPLDKIDRLSASCPNCYEPWFAPNSPDIHPETKQPIDRLKEAILGLRNVSGVRIRLEIKGQNSN